MIWRGTAMIYLIAFISLWVQVEGLYGEGGISPLKDTMDYWRLKLGGTPWWSKPSLLWINFSNYDHHFLLGIGVISSFLMIQGILPFISALVCWICYLSFVSLGQSFLSYQWDALLLEMGFLSLFLHPKYFINFSFWPYRFLLFRLMFMSGLAKITSGDINWETLKALDYHYWTQPLPNFISWFVHQAPSWFHQISIIAMFAVELTCPFLIFFTRRFRLIAFYAFLFLQVAIIITGNYGFFNWLTIVLCFCLVDDQHWKWFFNSKPPMMPKISQFRVFASLILMLYTIVMGSLVLFKARLPRWVSPIARMNVNFHLINSYGLFSVMTTRRFEIFLQGSFNNKDWKDYHFNYKPNSTSDRPEWVFFHMPRLDWQMWFAALNPRPPGWFYRMVGRLLRGDESVAGLFENNPFPTRPPRYIRAIIYDYKFSSVDDFFDYGRWWKSSYKREYLPPVSKK